MCLYGRPLSFILLLHPEIELRNGHDIFSAQIQQQSVFCITLNFLIERTKFWICTGPYKALWAFKELDGLIKDPHHLHMGDKNAHKVNSVGMTELYYQ